MTKTGNKVAPTSTTLQARVALFQPSQRPISKKGQWVETQYGQCRVTGRLGQRHADVLESILYVAEKKRTTDDGGVELLVDPYILRQSLSERQYSHQGLLDLLAELRAASIEIITPELEKSGDRIIGGLVDHVVPSPMTRSNPLGGERNLWKIRLGIALITLLDKDLSLYYEPAPIAQLQHGISQAIARHILTHKNTPKGGWHVDTLIHAVTGGANSRALRNGRYRLKQDSDLLLKMGIALTENKRIKLIGAVR